MRLQSPTLGEKRVCGSLLRSSEFALLFSHVFCYFLLQFSAASLCSFSSSSCCFYSPLIFWPTSLLLVSVLVGSSLELTECKFSLGSRRIAEHRVSALLCLGKVQVRQSLLWLRLGKTALQHTRSLRTERFREADRRPNHPQECLPGLILSDGGLKVGLLDCV